MKKDDWPFTIKEEVKLKLSGIWFKKPKQKEPIKKCLTCNNLAKSRVAKYCLDCSYKRAVANNSKQSLRRYHRNKNEIR